jgi:hypothetical protein
MLREGYDQDWLRRVTLRCGKQGLNAGLNGVTNLAEYSDDLFITARR